MDEENESVGSQGGKSALAFRTISEVAGDLDVPQHVLRFWETKFSQVRPMKRGGGRRYYRPDDVLLLRRIRDLLYTEGYTIRGVQRLLRQIGVRAVLDDSFRASSEQSETTTPVAANESSQQDQPDNAAGDGSADFGDESDTVEVRTETVIDPTGLGPEARANLNAVLDDLIALRDDIRGPA